MSRVPIPNSLRFEVFKRDKFTCQYCGAKAPDVVLNADHIEPVAEGGKTDLLNLITSCRTCNSGKGAVRLSDTQAIDKQIAMLEDLEERRQQIEMMLKWRDELQGFQVDLVEKVARRIEQRGIGFSPNENGKAHIRRWLKRIELDVLLQAVDESFDSYGVFKDDKITNSSWQLAFDKIPAVARILKADVEKPYLRRVFYVLGILRKRTKECIPTDTIEYLEHLVLAGADLDEMELRAKRVTSFDDFAMAYDVWLKSIGDPY